MLFPRSSLFKDSRHWPIFIFCILYLSIGVNSVFSQTVSRQTLYYTPPQNGFEVQVPFAWKFIDCFGDVNLTISQDYDKITSQAYIYNGRKYTSLDLGNDAFSKPKRGLTNISGDVFVGSYRLGRVELNNVIDWIGGCFGQTYSVISDLGLKNEEYKNRLNELSMKNLRIDEISNRDYELEGKIKEIEKQRELKEIIASADAAFWNGNLEEAEKLYKEILRKDPNNASAKSRLGEIESKKKAEASEKKYQSHIDKGDTMSDKGDYPGAISEYKKALQEKPNDGNAKNKLAEIQEKLKEKDQQANRKKMAKTAAGSRSHQGFFWGRNLGADAPGTSMQAANLIGNFRLDYNIWTLGGEPAHKFRFYWEWNNFSNTGYPLWVSILSDTVVSIADLAKYPDLISRWNRIKPLYIEVEVEIVSYQNADEYVASAGKMRVIIEDIGRSGEEIDWPLPSSSDWDELFPYCNHLRWDYFREIGLYNEVDEYADKFGSKIAWPKYTFEYSDHIDFYFSHEIFFSEYKKITMNDCNRYSSSADITKIVWPVNEVQAVIKEFETREKEKAEEKMSADDFWSTPESGKKANSTNKDFWNTSENNTTKKEFARQKQNQSYSQAMNAWPSIRKRRQEKYKALQNPITIKTPLNNSVHKKNVVTIEGSINKYFIRYSNKVFLKLNGVKQQVDISSNGSFSNAMVLSNGLNDIKFELKGNGFTIEKSLKIKYEGVKTDIRVTLTWNSSGSDLDLYVKDPNSSSCYYQNRNVGKMSLDVDDQNGYGPENISVVQGSKGNYSVQVQNYANGEGTEATVYIYVNEILKTVKKHRFSRKREIWNVSNNIYLN